MKTSSFETTTSQFDDDSEQTYINRKTNGVEQPLIGGRVLGFIAIDASMSAEPPTQNEGESMTETAGAYAQEKPEYQQYVAQATQLVHELARGDEGGLSAVPATFQEALSVRMKQRLEELMSTKISQGEFNLEVKKMISVACGGLREAAEN